MFTYRTFDSRQVSPHPEIFKKALPSGPANSKMRLVLVLVYFKLLYVTLNAISLLFFPPLISCMVQHHKLSCNL